MFSRATVPTEDRRKEQLEPRLKDDHRRDPKRHSTDADYMLLHALSGTIHSSSDTWLIDSGASRHMTGYWKLLFDLEKKESSQNVILGDDARYAVRGIGATSFQLKSGKTLKMKCCMCQG